MQQSRRLKHLAIGPPTPGLTTSHPAARHGRQLRRNRRQNFMLIVTRGALGFELGEAIGSLIGKIRAKRRKRAPWPNFGNSPYGFIPSMTCRIQPYMHVKESLKTWPFKSKVRDFGKGVPL